MVGSKATTRVILTVRDRQLLDELRVLRVVDREQVMLFGGFNSTTRANARLLALTRAGCLKRTFVGTINGGRKAIYFLPGHHSGALQRSPLALESAVVHQLAVNQLYHAFRYGTPSQAGVQFGEWRTVESVLSPAVPLIPDGIVRFRTPEGEQVACVEVDLGTESLRVWENKIVRYLQLARSGEHGAILHADQFKVLVIASGTRRMQNIQRTVSNHTSKLFWLTTIETAQHRGVWAPIWLRPSREVSGSCARSLVQGTEGTNPGVR